jgi:telomere length regulation protein
MLASEENPHWWKIDAENISAAAGLINKLLGNQDSRRMQLITWLTGSSGAGVGETIAIRRASIASLSESKNDVEVVFDKSLQQFGDQLYIKHTPIMQQEGLLSTLYLLFVCADALS